MTVVRDWTEEDVRKLRGTYDIEYSIAARTSDLLRKRFEQGDKPVRALGASTPAQAVQMAQAGLLGIYLSGWQVAADVNGDMYPDQSLYPSDCVPKLVKAINNALLRQDRIESVSGGITRDWLVPIIADIEAGFGGNLNAYELTKKCIEAGAAAIHIEDQLSSAKKCGHLGGKVLVPTQEMINKLKAVRLAADVCDVPLLVIARTDANSAKLLTSDIDYRDISFIDGIKDEHGPERTSDGFYRIKGGLEQAIQRGLAYAPYADLLWCETSKPNLGEAREFAEAIHEKFPGKWLAYNCSPSFNWVKHISEDEALTFHRKLFEYGYVFQFITLAGFHSLNHAMFGLSLDFNYNGMSAYRDLQSSEFLAEEDAYKAVKHQKFVGTGYFDTITQLVSGGETAAMIGSTEEEQF